MTNVYVNQDRYLVSIFPDGHDRRRHFTITVEHRGDDRWAILHMGFCLGVDGDWDYEPRPSERDDDWLDTHRFGRDEALRLAERHAPIIEVNGVTATEWQQREANR